MIYGKKNPLRVFTAFSGYDSQCLALERLKKDYGAFDYRLIGWSEIDKAAITAHDALFPEARELNYGDISSIAWESVPDFDLFTYSFPCQDISAAGLQKGLKKGEGTRSGLLWECEKAIRIKRPKFLLMENVKALVSKKFIKDYHEWVSVLDSFGYTSFGQVLNAKDYGVPQNRERIFLVSIHMDGLEGLAGEVQYHFPRPFQLERRLKNVLEDKVDEKYYLSDGRIEGLMASSQKEKERGNGFAYTPADRDGAANTIKTMAGNRKTDNFLSE